MRWRRTFGWLIPLAVLGCDAGRPAAPAPAVTRAALPLGWQVSELRPDRGWDWIGGFGRTMDFDGESIIVGSPQKDDGGEGSGAAYIFVRDGAGFRQQAKLVDPDKGPLDRFGSAVSISGDFAFVGAPFYEDNVSAIAMDFGALHVYQRAGDLWRYRMRLRGSVLHEGDQLGHAVCVRGDLAVVGTPAEERETGTNLGVVDTFVYRDDAWRFTGAARAPDAESYDAFGNVLHHDRATLVVGVPQDDDAGTSSGSAHVFTRNGDAWDHVVKLVADDAAGGDLFGAAVAVDGDRIVIGAPGDDDQGSGAGALYAFARGPSGWAQVGKLVAPGGAAGQELGAAVALRGAMAVAGAVLDADRATASGSAHVFEDTGTGWVHRRELHADNAAQEGRFGTAVAIDGSQILATALRDADSIRDNGAIFTFDRATGTQQERIATIPERAGNHLGQKVALDGDIAVLGEPDNDVAGQWSGALQVFMRTASGQWTHQAMLASSAGRARDAFGVHVAIDRDTIATAGGGALHVYTRDGAVWNEQRILLPPGDGTGHVSALDVSGDTVAVGNAIDGTRGQAGGAVHLYQRASGAFAYATTLYASATGSQTWFGDALAIQDDTLIVDTHYDQVYAFERDAGGSWVERQQIIPPLPQRYTGAGSTIALDGDTLALAASLATHIFTRGADGMWGSPQLVTGATLGERVYTIGPWQMTLSGDRLVALGHGTNPDNSWESALLLYERRAGSWSGPTVLMATDDADAVADRSTGFGQALAIQGNTLLVGAPSADVHGENSGNAYVFEFGATAPPDAGPPDAASGGSGGSGAGSSDAGRGATADGGPAIELDASASESGRGSVPGTVAGSGAAGGGQPSGTGDASATDSEGEDSSADAGNGDSGGCGCSTLGARNPRSYPSIGALTVLLLCALRRTRRRGRSCCDHARPNLCAVESRRAVGTTRWRAE